MVRKKIDQRIRTLIENNVFTGHRSFFVVIGDHGRDQVINLHYILSKAQVARRPSVLWCYKKELGFSSNRKKRMNRIKKRKALGNASSASNDTTANPTEDPFELFLTQTDIRYAYYHETDKILGNTYGMLILQDFEALTPNLLARTIETVQGGGVVVLLLKTLTSLKQLYTMSMDAHSRYRTATRFDTVARFNERFLLSLTTNPNCLVVTDQLDIVPFSQYASNITPLERSADDDIKRQTRVTVEQAELDAFKTTIAEAYANKLVKGTSTSSLLANSELAALKLLASLVPLTRTLDQARALETFVSSLIASGPTISGRRVVSLTAGRGRGKSATMGLALAAAFTSGFGNVFLTSPSPENLKTLFDFVLKGLDALGWMEHVDYDLVQSTNPDFNRAIVRINLHRTGSSHRQTLLYIAPGDAHLLGQAELMVIDEAAAIPLPLVQALISGQYQSWMASTIQGYEGTGRSLSLKLLQSLRESQSGTLTELSLNEPIRYSAGDAVEKWLNSLLCLDIPMTMKNLAGACPHPSACDLYLVNRDTLFSFHKASEAFLQRMMTLFVASHYKNSPNDLQLLSDAPAHKLFVLLAPPNKETPHAMPEILAAVQVSLEGSLSRQVILNSFARGKREAGDLIPWTVSQQFQEENFASLSGARIVRIAVHPELQGMGYGTRAMELVERFYRGDLLSSNLEDIEDDPEDLAVAEGNTSVLSPAASPVPQEKAGDSSLIMTEAIKPRAALKPLLSRVSDVRPAKLDWLGVSFGLTSSLYKFYQRLGYQPVYLRQTTNDITGEHSTIMIKDIAVETSAWLSPFNEDFKRRFVSLCAYQFKALPVALCLDILQPGRSQTSAQTAFVLSPYDLKRLESYANNMLDYHMIMDLVPSLARAYFLNQLPRVASEKDCPAESIEPAAANLSSGFSLSPVQAAIIAALGLQHRLIEDLEQDLKLPVSQLLAMFVKAVRKLSNLLRQVRMAELKAEETTSSLHTAGHSLARRAEHPEAEFSEDEAIDTAQTAQDLKADLEEGGKRALSALKEQQRALINSLPLDRFAIVQGDSSTEQAWSEELARKNKKIKASVVSVPRPGGKQESDANAGSMSRELYNKFVAANNSVPSGNGKKIKSSSKNKSKGKSSKK